MDDNSVVFDLQKALEQVGGDREMLKEIINIYREEYPKQLQEIQEAIKKNNAATVDSVAHTIKGAVGNFGAKPAFEAALNLEKIGKSGNLSEALDAFNTLKAELELLEQELKKT
ncbi:MAG: Hpt domain-containing protein [Candidatus Omnitrophica bacterium]|nr:Hpt domain-containing protein [Candidatus Omnitrophota bacterium]